MHHNEDYGGGHGSGDESLGDSDNEHWQSELGRANSRTLPSFQQSQPGQGVKDGILDAKEDPERHHVIKSK